MTEEQTPEPTQTVLVMGWPYWGSGPTLEAAKNRFRTEGGRLSNGYAVITFDAETEFLGITDMGYYSFKRRDGDLSKEPNPPTVENVKRKGPRR